MSEIVDIADSHAHAHLLVNQDAHVKTKPETPPEVEVSVNRVVLAEFLSTWVMMCCGIGVCAQHLFSEAASCASSVSGRHTATSAAGNMARISCHT